MPQASYVAASASEVGSTGPYTFGAGSDRVALWFATWESGFVTEPTSITVGGQVMTPVRIAPLAGNQLVCYVLMLNEAQIAATTDGVIAEVWGGTVPSNIRRTMMTFENVDQTSSIAVNQIKSDTGFAITPTSVETGVENLVVEIGASGSAGAFTYINFTEILTGGSGYQYSIAVQESAAGGTVNEEFDVPTTNTRSFLETIVFNSVSTAPLISYINTVETNNAYPSQVSGVSGIRFGTQGTNSKLTISPTNNIADANAVDVSLNFWIDTLIVFAMPVTFKYGPIYAFVTSDSLEVSSGHQFECVPPAGKSINEIISPSAVGIYRDITGIEANDQVEYDTTSSGGGTVDVLLSGIADVQYNLDPPLSDSIKFRIFDDNLYVWSSIVENSNTVNISDSEKIGEGSMQAQPATVSGAGLLNIEDDFQGHLVAWTERVGSNFSTADGVLKPATVEVSAISALLFTVDTPPTLNQHVSVKLGPTTASNYYGLLLRSNNIATPTAYWISITSGTTTVSKLTNGAWGGDIWSTALTGWAEGDTLATSVHGTGANTVIDIWKNPVGADPVEWGTPDYSINVPGVDAIADTGDYLGIANYDLTLQTAAYLDDFKGGSFTVITNSTDGTVQSQQSTVSGVGVRVVTGSGSVQAQSATVTSEGDREITGTGTLISQEATVTGSGTRSINGEGVLQSQEATVVGAGSRTIEGAGTLNAQEAVVTGSGSREITGEGTVQAQPSTVTGEVVEENSGAFQAEPATVVGVGFRTITGSGAMIAQSATVNSDEPEVQLIGIRSVTILDNSRLITVRDSRRVIVIPND